MRGIIVGALLLASGTLATGCRYDEAARQETPSTEQPAAQPAAPTETEGGGTGGAGSVEGEGSAVGARSVEITEDETVVQENLGGSDAATERGWFDDRNSVEEGVGGSGVPDDVPPPSDEEPQGP